jgi:hypothetical protein
MTQVILPVQYLPQCRSDQDDAVAVDAARAQEHSGQLAIC